SARSCRPRSCSGVWAGCVSSAVDPLREDRIELFAGERLARERLAGRDPREPGEGRALGTGDVGIGDVENRAARRLVVLGRKRGQWAVHVALLAGLAVGGAAVGDRGAVGVAVGDLVVAAGLLDGREGAVALAVDRLV